MFFRRLAGIPLSHEQIKRIVIRVLADTTGVDIDEITEYMVVDLMGAATQRCPHNRYDCACS